MLLPLILASSALAQEPVYPEGAEIPASLTPAERAWLAENPLLPPARTPGLSAAPPTEVWCPPEYAPMDGILISWEGSNSWKDILADMAREITTIGDADVHVMVDTTSERSSATTTLQNNGVNMSRVIFHVVTTDSIWIRDYGPRYIYQGQVRSVVDHVYNRPRPQDDMQPVYFADALGHARYDIPLVHGGGNFHLDGQDTGYTTRLISDENPGLTEQEIADLWREFQGLDMVFFDPYSAFIDSTQHLDMWMQVVADDVVVISDWVNDQGSTQDLICEAAAFEMQARGFTVLRTPARRVFGTHYTYTNVVMCNDLVLIPSYSNGTISQYNAQALATWQQACPGKTIVPIDAQAIVTSAGVLHCIVMHLPAHLGGADPTARLTAPVVGASYDGGEQVLVEWISDDDVAATSAELWLTWDGGASESLIAAGLPAAGSTLWDVPFTDLSGARLEVRVFDGDGNTGEDASQELAIGEGAFRGSYGEGKPGTLGVPQLSATALPVLGASVTIQVDAALPNGSAYLLRGFATASIPFDGGTVWVNHDRVYPLQVDGFGAASLTATVPNNPALIGLSTYWQAWVQDDPQATGAGWASSAGLELKLGT